MSIIAATYSPDFINYWIPDNNVTPAISSKDYFYSANNKNFIFKFSNGIDFWGVDNSYFNNNTFTTI
jgi:hypothetical protein